MRYVLTNSHPVVGESCLSRLPAHQPCARSYPWGERSGAIPAVHPIVHPGWWKPRCPVLRLRPFPRSLQGYGPGPDVRSECAHAREVVFRLIAVPWLFSPGTSRNPSTRFPAGRWQNWSQHPANLRTLVPLTSLRVPRRQVLLHSRPRRWTTSRRVWRQPRPPLPQLTPARL